MSVSISVERSIPEDTDTRTTDASFDQEAIVEVLADDDAVELFQSATRPKSVSTLADDCDVPLSRAKMAARSARATEMPSD